MKMHIEEARAAGDRWSLRYTEALAMEAAYQRRRMDRIEAALEREGISLNEVASEV